jgi:Leucine-rich repeat (LRR) protein
MQNQLIQLNSSALSRFNKTLDLAQQVVEENEFHNADWFDTPEKRLRWWMDLEPQWRRAFTKAVFFKHRNPERYQATDSELQMLFETEELYITGFGVFENRNNSYKINFQLTNLSGVTNLTNLTRIECDYNRFISSLEPLSQLHKLRTLWCDNNSITDLSPLMGLESLKSLCIWNNQITSLEPILSIPNLDNLVISMYRQGNPIEDMSPLDDWKSVVLGTWWKY